MPTIISCGFIKYQVGDDCIVVARKRPSGAVETMNSSAGRFLIKNGKADIYPFWRPRILERSEADAQKEMGRTNLRNKTPAETMDAMRRLLPTVEQETQSKRNKSWWQFWR